METIKIQESTMILENGKKGKVAILIYAGDGNDDPVIELDKAVEKYVENDLHYQFIDINMDNPWYRVILSDINEMMQEPFDPSKHKLSKEIKPSSYEND